MLIDLLCFFRCFLFTYPTCNAQSHAEKLPKDNANQFPNEPHFTTHPNNSHQYRHIQHHQLTIDNFSSFVMQLSSLLQYFSSIPFSHIPLIVMR